MFPPLCQRIHSGSKKTSKISVVFEDLSRNSVFSSRSLALIHPSNIDVNITPLPQVECRDSAGELSTDENCLEVEGDKPATEKEYNLGACGGGGGGRALLYCTISGFFFFYVCVICC